MEVTITYLQVFVLRRTYDHKQM